MNDLTAYREVAKVGGRCTGKTTRLIKALPDGGIYITHSSAMAGVVKAYLAQIGRDPKSIQVFSVNQSPDIMRGRRREAVAIDHYVIEDRLLSDEWWDMILHRSSIVLRTDEEGDVVVTYNKDAL